MSNVESLWTLAYNAARTEGLLRTATHYVVVEGKYGPKIVVYTRRDGGGEFNGDKPSFGGWSNECGGLIAAGNIDINRIDIPLNSNGDMASGQQLWWDQVARVVRKLPRILYFAVYKQEMDDKRNPGTIAYRNVMYSMLPFHINTAEPGEVAANALTLGTAKALTDRLAKELTHYVVRDVGTFDREFDTQKSTLVIDWYNVKPVRTGGETGGFNLLYRDGGTYLDSGLITADFVQTVQQHGTPEFAGIIQNAVVGKFDDIQPGMTASTSGALALVMKTGALKPIGCRMLMGGYWYQQSGGENVFYTTGVLNTSPYANGYLDNVQKTYEEFGAKRPIRKEPEPRQPEEAGHDDIFNEADPGTYPSAAEKSRYVTAEYSKMAKSNGGISEAHAMKYLALLKTDKEMITLWDDAIQSEATATELAGDFLLDAIYYVTHAKDDGKDATIAAMKVNKKK